MKKVFLTLALAAFAFAANAQFIVGGSFGVAGENDEFNSRKELEFNFTPKIGYQITDKMSAGLIFGYNYTNYSNPNYTRIDPTMLTAISYESTRKNVQSHMVIKPYFRYNIMEISKLTLFCEAAISVNLPLSNKTVFNEEGDDAITGSHLTAESTIDNAKSTIFGLDITPGVNYALTDNLSIDAYINAINLGFSMTKIKGNDNSDINWNLNASSLPRSTVGFGFNYHF